MRFFDFHTHPYIAVSDTIKRYPTAVDDTGYAHQRAELERVGIYRAAGSVIANKKWEGLAKMQYENEVAMQIYEAHSDFFVPGIRIDARYIKESCEAVENAHKKGLRLIGELTPYHGMNWNYADCGEIFALAEEKGMIVSCHPTTDEDMCKVCAQFPHLIFVFAHPGENPAYMDHLARIQKYENAYLDISGTGLFRNGMLRYGIERVGAERILFGTDYPVCNPGMYTSGILFENIGEADLEKVAYKNAERILGI